MKGGVRRHAGLPLADLPPLFRQDFPQPGHFGAGSPLGGQGGDLGFHQVAQLKNLLESAGSAVQVGRDQIQGCLQIFGVDKGAGTPPADHQPLHFQSLQGLPHRTAADLELLGQIPFRRQAVAVPERALADKGMKLLHDVLVQAPPFNLAHHPSRSCHNPPALRKWSDQLRLRLIILGAGGLSRDIDTIARQRVL